MKKSIGYLSTGLLVLILQLSAPQSGAKEQKIDSAKPRLVMVEVPSWKTTFFGLPRELPVLIQPGEAFDAKSRQYDFNDGIPAMDVFVRLRPKDEFSKAYRLFLQKWPLYQKLFTSIDQEKYEEAASLLSRIEKIDPKEPAVYFYLGSLQTHLGKYADAEKHYLTCLRYFPEYGPAYINLARLYKARGADQEAHHALEEAVRRLEKSGQEDALRIAQKMLESINGK